MDEKREMLRHAVATVAYRAEKSVRGAPESFAAFAAGPSSRTPAQILGHMSDLFDWALSIAQGTERWGHSQPLPWDREVARFFEKLELFEAFLGSDAPLAASAERLFQGPVADALTHVGQLAMLRRLAGSSVRGENYFNADIAAGRVGRAQPAPGYEFD
jgi:hypothetical protein